MTLPFKALLVLLAALFGAAGEAVHAQSVVPLESVIDWKRPLAQDAAAFEKAVNENFPNARREDRSEKKTILFLTESGDANKFSAFADVAVDTCYAVLADGRIEALDIEVRAAADAVAKKLKDIYGSDPKPVGIHFADGSQEEGLIWRYPQFELVLSASGNNAVLYVTVAQSESLSTASEAAPLKVKVDLDLLLKPADLWKLSVEGLEKFYTPDMPGKMAEPPQFAWLDKTKTKARFYRKLYANLDTRLTMFGGSIKVEEAIIEFSGGKAVRATVSFYNRGDAGPMTKDAFERLYKTIGQNLGKVYLVAPRSQLMSANAALKTVGWVWTTPINVAVLEYADYAASGQPEFLRMKLAAPGQEDWSMGQLAVGVQRMALLENVKRDADGDVYISGVPMVDQGAKGYCVAASCQRLFEYMHIPCDQHEMADLLHIEADKGADVYEMQKCLARIDGKFSVAFKPLINAENYFDSKGRRRVSFKEFTTLVREHVDKGVPLLWGLQLGIHAEEPPLPGDGQTVGGHMRMIIGYNSQTKKILFTDSWGAGHELKRMDLADAYDVTVGVYAVSPRGL